MSQFDDPRIVFIDREQNRGLPFSFNEALAHARGEYICYLGDDDLLYPFHVETLLSALQKNPDIGVAYGDLYKVHCRIETDGRRTVLAKNVEVSRDYDRFAMLQFNHILHVSLMHRRDFLDRAGMNNENLICLIDWDLNRRLSFYTDFLHVHRVIGEYYAAIPEYQQRCERISSRKQKSLPRYVINHLTIQSTRPSKPWPKMKDLSIILLTKRLGPQTEQALREIWSHTFFPYQILLPLTRPELDRLQRNTVVPNILGIPVPDDLRLEHRIDTALRFCQGDFVALVPDTWRIAFEEVAWIEKSVYPLLEGDPNVPGFELVGSKPDCWAAVFRSQVLRDARSRFADLSIHQSLHAAGIRIRQPVQAEWPFQMENLISNAEFLERAGAWLDAAAVYEMAERRFGNELWMQTRRANALYQSDRLKEAAEIAIQLNHTRPTVATLILEARIRRKQNRIREAIDLWKKAENILDESEPRNAGMYQYETV
jgi:tetratricopeptide (TPR) repeat protein